MPTARKTKAVTRNGLPPFTKEQMAKGGRARKGKNYKQYAEALADEVLKDAQKEPSKRRTKAELLAVAGYLPSVGKKSAEVWNTQSLREALAKRGFTQEKMSRVLEEAADAKVVTVFKGDARETDAPDHAIRLRAVDQLADVMGLKKLTVAQLNVDVNMGEEATKDLLGL